jgi:ABC-type nitrate/sulfonate/bicarbonate transport system permease component
MKKRAITLLVFCGLLIAWELLVILCAIPEYLLPSPSSIAHTIAYRLPFLASNAVSTVQAALLGLLFAVLLGATLAIGFARYPRLGGVGESLLGSTQTVPVLAIAPILTAWLGTGLSAKVAAASIVSLPVITVTLSRGLHLVQRDEIDLFRSMGATLWQIVWYLRVPRALPILFVALRTAVPLSILGTIVGEFVGAERGLGTVILRSSYYLKTSEMFAAIVVLSFISIAITSVIEPIRRHFEWKE